MKAVVGPFGAWFCTILSVFAIVILSFIALMFHNNHEEFVGSINDPDNAQEVARTIMYAVCVYVFFFFCCGSQIFIHKRNSRVVLQ